MNEIDNIVKVTLKEIYKKDKAIKEKSKILTNNGKCYLRFGEE